MKEEGRGREGEGSEGDGREGEGRSGGRNERGKERKGKREYVKGKKGRGINLQCLFSNPQHADSQDITPSGSQSLVFPSDSVVGGTRCVTYEIVGDEFKEEDETLTVTLEQENMDDTISNTRQISITIEDDGDCK